MTEAIAIYLGLTISLAALVVLYVANVLRTFASPPDRAPHPVLALFPPMTPVVAWRAGSRVLPVLLVMAAVAYVALQIWANAR